MCLLPLFESLPNVQNSTQHREVLERWWVVVGVMVGSQRGTESSRVGPSVTVLEAAALPQRGDHCNCCDGKPDAAAGLRTRPPWQWAQ